MKSLLLLFILALSLSQAQSQKIIVGGKESDGKLQWSDFTGRVDKSSTFYAYTAYNIHPKIEGINLQGDSVSIANFEVILTLDPQKSWSRKDKQTEELLIHEQGHFNIGILCMRELVSTYKATKWLKAGFGAQMQTMISTVMKKYHEMGMRYDRETKHSMNKAEQEKWNLFFAQSLGQ